MKQIYSMIAMLLFTAVAFAQQPIITTVLDGDCSGGTPKMIEIYANGTVDFSQYTLQTEKNTNTEFGADLSLADAGVVTDGFIYVTTTNSLAADEGETSAFASEFPSLSDAIVLTGGAADGNGDDRFRIIDAQMTVIDQYGESGVNGDNEIWDYTDSYATRINGTGPDGGFNPGNWNYAGRAALNNLGVCQGQAETFESIIGTIGQFSTTGSTEPSLSILSPANGATLTDGALESTISVSNFTLSSSATAGDGDGYIVYQLDTEDAVNKFDTDPITISGIAPGEHTLVVRLVDNSGADVSEATTQSVTFTVPSQQAINSIADLRSQDVGGDTVFTLNSEAIVTRTEGFRNQKYIEDETGAILIDDPQNVIPDGVYEEGDGITGLSGTLGEFRGLLQFTPTEDPGAPSSSDNVITPQEVSLAELAQNSEEYESELVTIIEEVEFTDADGERTFTNNDNLTISDGTTNFLVRNFFGEDFTDEVVPDGFGSITGIVRQDDNVQAGAYAISPRNADDIETLTLSNGSVEAGLFTVYPNPANDVLNITAANGNAVDVIIYSALGQEVISQKAVSSSINVNNLRSGLYVVKITQDNASQTRKLVIK
ncbi:T9SS type A sorting domain-containing protein [Nonlabens ponticola]|nr:T9SS type A sorting domain-containing protein [Nonlabens ponticola]